MLKYSCALILFVGSLFAEDKKEEKPTVRGHVFAWPFLEAAEMQPRGGMTRGTEVTLATEDSAAWEKLQQGGLSKLERDRRAILAMAGDYRVSFDFVEVLGLTSDYQPPKPYFSWGTEQVAVLKNEPRFISLQHTLVMFFKDEDGKESPPMIMKHWRQDWTYEDEKILNFMGRNTWQEVTNPLPSGTWTQAVYQVDDSPRYESFGTWDHIGGRSVFTGQSDRPLPRREFSQRDDYQLLASEDQLVITPTGWVHLQNNDKVQVSSRGDRTIIARELGVNRYERISAPSLQAAAEQWEKVSPYWEEVRRAWDKVIQEKESFTLQAKVDDKKLWQHHFGYASKVLKDGWDAEDGKKHAQETISRFLQSGAGEKSGY